MAFLLPGWAVCSMVENLEVLIAHCPLDVDPTFPSYSGNMRSSGKVLQTKSNKREMYWTFAVV